MTEILSSTPSLATQSARPPAPARPVLLVVDDDEGCREALRLLFGEHHQVLLAPSGPEGLQLAAQHPVNLAITDLRMPGMSGLDFVARLKAFDPAIEVIILTGYQTVESARQALRLGAYEFLIKPFELPSLRQAVAGALARAAKTRMLRDLETQNYQQNLQQELLCTKNQIYAGILHDLSGPLSAIGGLTDILQKIFAQVTQVEGAELAEIQSYIAQVSSQSHLCIDIALRYRQFTQAQDAHQKSASINHVLSELEQVLRFHPHAKEQQWHIHKLATDIAARIDAVDLMQILLNLTINALQSTPAPHRVEVEAACSLQPLDWKHFPEGPGEIFLNREQFPNTAPLLAITVNDNGPGIPPETVGKIFEPYFTTKSARQNSGLGLTIVQRCIEASQAGLHLRSQPGEGTLFTLYLSAAAPPSG